MRCSRSGASGCCGARVAAVRGALCRGSRRGASPPARFCGGAPCRGSALRRGLRGWGVEGSRSWASRRATGVAPYLGVVRDPRGISGPVTRHRRVPGRPVGGRRSAAGGRRPPERALPRQSGQCRCSRGGAEPRDWGQRGCSRGERVRGIRGQRWCSRGGARPWDPGAALVFAGRGAPVGSGGSAGVRGAGRARGIRGQRWCGQGCARLWHPGLRRHPRRPEQRQHPRRRARRRHRAHQRCPGQRGHRQDRAHPRHPT
ncbi:hypothetical protein JOE64_000545 [Microbacterium dextranolyticum]|nr:hypothetical protein [Microbacterium dextranolyticum]